MMTSFIAAVLEGDREKSLAGAQRLRESGVSPEQIVVHGLEAAMSALDAKCTLEQFNLLEIMLAGRAVTEVMKLLYPYGIVTTHKKAIVVIATLEGDVHDLGKNILKMVLTGKGYRVIDCGTEQLKSMSCPLMATGVIYPFLTPAAPDGCPRC